MAAAVRCCFGLCAGPQSSEADSEAENVKSALGLERPISADDKTCALLNHDDSFPSVRSVATGLLQHHEAMRASQMGIVKSSESLLTVDWEDHISM